MGKTNQAIAGNILPSTASNFPTKSEEKAAIKSIGGSSKLGVGDTAAPLSSELAACQTQRRRGMDEGPLGTAENATTGKALTRTAQVYDPGERREMV